MPRTLEKILAPDEPLTGKAYLLIGIALFAVKFAIDSAISGLILHRPWSPINYLSPAAAIGIPDSSAELVFVWIMLAISIPFVITGIMLTARRLRTAGLPTWLVAIFFIPLINFIFFIVIGLHPARREIPIAQTAAASPPAPQISPDAMPLNYARDQLGPGSTLLAKILPRTPGRSTLVALLAPIPIGAAAVLFGVHVLKTYGAALFVGLPFILPMLAVLLRSFHEPLRLGQCLRLAAAAIIIYSVCLMLLAIEGTICILMALPIAIPIALLGGLLGYLIQRARHVNAAGTFLALLLFLPLFMGAERAALPTAPIYAVTSTVEINAPPARVWKNVISFPDLAPPTELIFRSGIAYPQRARIDGQGVGACRYCIFSTGAFVEPITVWDESKLLRFDVTENPPPLRELSPYNIHPPHLNNFLVSHAGQFRLIELENGRTRLEGTTWYQHNMWPAAYWRFWSDSILHKIHLRVLNHVKRLSENE